MLTAFEDPGTCKLDKWKLWHFLSQGLPYIYRIKSLI